MRHTDTGTRHIKVNILYKTVKPFKGVLISKCKNRAIGAKNAPSWKKICFQLGKLFFPTGNLKLGGYCIFCHFPFIFHPPKHEKEKGRKSKNI
jgi:hypothetical protein